MTKSVSSNSPNRVVGGVEAAPFADLRLRHEERAQRFGERGGLARDGADLGDRSDQSQHGALAEDDRAKAFRERLDASLRKNERSRSSTARQSERDKAEAIAESGGFPGLALPWSSAAPVETEHQGQDESRERWTPRDQAAAVPARVDDRTASIEAGAASIDRPSDKPRQVRILATAEPPADSLTSLFRATSPARPEGGTDPAESGRPSVGARLERVAARVEEAIRAELTAGSVPPVEIKIPIDPGMEGLQSLTVLISDKGIDVIIARGAVGTSEALMQAAQALADRLQRRSGKASVRVLDLVDQEDVHGKQALDDPIILGRENA